MTRTLAAIGLCAAALAAPTVLAADFDWSPCAKEIALYCKDVKGDEAIYQCLLKRDADLSKTCDNNAHTKYEILTKKKR